PSVMLLKSVDLSFSGGIRWKPISNYQSFAGFPAADTNFTSLTVAPDGRTIQFGTVPPGVSDPDITALANTTHPVRWFYIAINNLSKWYIVSSAGGSNPSVMLLKSVDPSFSGGIRWKPISNY